LILQTGRQIDLGGGNVKTLLAFENPYAFGFGTASDDGQDFVFNDAGQFVFTAQFTDGTEAVVIAQVPEAGVGILVVVIAGLSGLRCRRI
jgi:hypothetical protein